MPTRPLLLALAVLSGEPGEVDQEEVERIFVQGQEHYEAKEYEAALERFETLLDMFPEVDDNTSTRETLILLILEVSRRAYHGVVDEDGQYNKEFLERGLERLRRYQADYEAAYGAPSQSAALASMAQELRVELEAEPDVGPCLSPYPPCLSPPPIEPKRGCGGETDGVASLMLLPFALRRRRKSILERVRAALPADVVARIRGRLDSDEQEPP